MFSAKWTFTIGFAWLGAFSLGLGFVDKKNTFIALRSLQGIGAALTVRPDFSLAFPRERRPTLRLLLATFRSDPFGLEDDRTVLPSGGKGGCDLCLWSERSAGERFVLFS